MLDKRFDAIEAADLEALVERRVPESRTLEFKRELTPDPAHIARGKGKGKDKDGELLRDITALANSQGGDLFIGIGEEAGVASDVCGVVLDSLDGQRQTFENLLRDRTEPRLSSLQLQFIPVAQGRHVIHFRVRPSLAAPHAVRTGTHRNYFIRNSAGKHEMDVGELRTAFVANEQLIPKLRKLHHDAIRAAAGENMPFSLADAPRCILSLVPIASLRDRNDFTIGESDALVPFRAQATQFVPTLEGLLAHSAIEVPHANSGHQGVVSSYALNHWSGRYDIAWTIGYWRSKGSIGWSFVPNPIPDREGHVHPDRFEQGVLGMARSGIAKLRELGLDGPWAIFVTVEGLTQTRLSFPDNERSDACCRDRAVLGELVLDEASEETLAPLAQGFWRLFAMRRPDGRSWGSNQSPRASPASAQSH